MLRGLLRQLWRVALLGTSGRRVKLLPDQYLQQRHLLHNADAGCLHHCSSATTTSIATDAAVAAFATYATRAAALAAAAITAAHTTATAMRAAWQRRYGLAGQPRWTEPWQRRVGCRRLWGGWLQQHLRRVHP